MRITVLSWSMLCLLPWASLVSAQNSTASAQEKDRTALLAFKNSLRAYGLNGQERKRWWAVRRWVWFTLPCNKNQKWEYVECDNDGRVIAVNVSATSILKPEGPPTYLQGEIPWGAMKDLDKLTSLDVSGQRVTGEAFPSSTPNMPALSVLNLHGNQLSALTESVSALNGLTHLDLGGNTMLMNLVPSTITSLSKLAILNLGNTMMSNPWPTVLSSLATLMSLDLSNANFSGPLPDSYSLLNKLELLNVSHSPAGGSFPVSWSSLTALKTLSAAKCSLSGDFPSFLANLTGLVSMNLNNNSLIGPVPEGLWKLTGAIDISNNYLNGNAPDPVPQNIIYGGNCFTIPASGTVQKPTGDCNAVYANVPPPPLHLGERAPT